MGTVFALVLAVLAATPALAVRFGLFAPSVELGTLTFGLAIVGAAFAMSWAAEAAEHDIPRALALTVVALLAVFPEYAVDIIFAYKAGADPAFAPFATANMTGSNRLLLGVGWPAVALLAWLISGRKVLHVDRGAVLPLIFLGLATIYSFSLPLRQSIGVVDSLLLVVLFGTYAVIAARQESHEPDLVGPSAAIGALPLVARRLSVLGLFAFAGVTIALCAEPFAEGLVRTGERLGIDEFLLVQWLAPLASEAPEFLVAALLALRGKAMAGLTLLLSAKVNQWTLLVGSLPLAYSVGAGHIGALPLDDRQAMEVWLTAAQSLFGVAVLASLSLHVGEALLLAGLFLAQLVLSGVLRAGLHDAQRAVWELAAFSVVYTVLGVVLLVRARHAVGAMLRGDRAVLGAAEDQPAHAPPPRQQRPAA
jgi:cation:H+ antiporter